MTRLFFLGYLANATNAFLSIVTIMTTNSFNGNSVGFGQILNLMQLWTSFYIH